MQWTNYVQTYKVLGDCVVVTRVISCYFTVWWHVAGKISCICPFDSRAGAACERRCSAVWPLCDGEGADHCQWWITVFFSVLLSTTDSKDSSLRPSTEPAFLISSSLLVLLALMLLPQHTAAMKMPTQQQTGRRSPTSCCTRWKISASSGNRVLFPFLYTALVLDFQSSLLSITTPKYL